jgi:hypothetical protein
MFPEWWLRPPEVAQDALGPYIQKDLSSEKGLSEKPSVSLAQLRCPK